jgi:hypothetical protein
MGVLREGRLVFQAHVPRLSGQSNPDGIVRPDGRGRACPACPSPTTPRKGSGRKLQHQRDRHAARLRWRTSATAASKHQASTWDAVTGEIATSPALRGVAHRLSADSFRSPSPWQAEQGGLDLLAGAQAGSRRPTPLGEAEGHLLAHQQRRWRGRIRCKPRQTPCGTPAILPVLPLSWPGETQRRQAASSCRLRGIAWPVVKSPGSAVECHTEPLAVLCGPGFGCRETRGGRDVTENEQKQQFSIACVHAVAAQAGFTCQATLVDDDCAGMPPTGCPCSAARPRATRKQSASPCPGISC